MSKAMSRHVLLVDSERDSRAALASHLENAGFRVTAAGNGAGMTRALDRARIDLVLLEVSGAAHEGLEKCRRLRAASDVPCILMARHVDEIDRIVGLEMGADDYVPKPFDPRELAARVKSVLRRTSAAARGEIGDERVRMGRCVLDLAAHRLTDEDGVEVPMSPLEFDLLHALALHPNRPLSRERILNLRQRDWDPFDRSVDLRVMRLRRKIEPDPDHPRFIRTIRNEGYVFVPDGK